MLHAGSRVIDRSAAISYLPAAALQEDIGMAGKADIVDRLAIKVEGITKKQAGEVFDELFACVTDYLEASERVSIPRFGSFTVGERQARNGRNPVTGKPLKIDSSRVVRFRAGSDLKTSLNSRSRTKRR